MLLREEKTSFKKVQKKSTFSKGVSSWFLAKGGHFSHWWFLGKSSQERSFFDIRDREGSFLEKKGQLLISTKNREFPKG